MNIAIFGAAGSMGTRARNRLGGDPAYRILCVEGTDAGVGQLRAAGVEPITREDAAAQADVVLLAVPDHLIGRIAAEVVPTLRPGTMVICLDPAAPHAGRLPPRGDLVYFVTHPAHPPVFNDETDPAARRDFFGSGLAKQAIVSAILQGTDDDYGRGEKIARKLFGPILRSHRVTIEQMALLEPVLSETVAATALTMIREAMDEAIRRGVPPDAARDFLMGHINIELAILFNEIDWQFSAGCKLAIEEAKEQLFQPNWKKVFEPAAVRDSVARITGG
jgi:D-apionate oxidoisomerase